MAAEFYASSRFSRELCDQISSLEPLNPFRTLAYAESMKSLGMQPWLFYAAEQGRVISGCFGFMKSGRLDRSMEIHSVFPAGVEQQCWKDLESLCRRERVTVLSVGSYASASSEIPALSGETSRRKRVEHVLDLRSPDLRSTMSTNHRRNTQKAQKAGIVVERSTAAEACHAHVRLQDASMERRISLGQQVNADAQTRTPMALLEHRAGELFRATLGKQVLSSILILRSPRGAYYHSAGTCPEGMALGASHFLIWQVAETLRSEGVEQFNLGGADASNPGLERFKKGFGAQEIHLESAAFYLASPLRKKVNAAIQSFRSDPLGAIRDLLGRTDKYCVYFCSPQKFAGCPSPAGVAFRKISDSELLEAASRHVEMGMYKERYEKLSINDAYGVFVEGVLAHVSWLVPADHDRLNNERNVALRSDEAEITHAVTLDSYRNRGLYSYAIQCLVAICREKGIRRVYMITGNDNFASRKGIEKAGLRSAGRIWRVRYRHLGGRSFAIRGHRLLGFLYRDV
jgi:hypothetical protein